MTIDRKKNASRLNELNEKFAVMEDRRSAFSDDVLKLKKPVSDYSQADWKSAAVIKTKEVSVISEEIKLTDEMIDFLNGDRLEELRDDYEIAVAALPLIEKKIVDDLLSIGFLPIEGEPSRGTLKPDFWLSHPAHRDARDAIQNAYAAVEHLHGHVKVFSQQKQTKLDRLEKIKAQMIA